MCCHAVEVTGENYGSCAHAQFLRGGAGLAAKIKMEEVDGIIISTLKEVGW